MTARFAIAIPQTAVNGHIDVEHVRRCVIRAEELGFESAWAAEKIFGPLSTLEALTVVTFAASLTSTIRVGCGVIQTAVRGPVMLAKTLASLDQLCEGRLIVGVGLGSFPEFLAAQGLTAVRRAARYEEGLLLMKALWTEEVVTFDGEFYKVVQQRMEPKPRQKPYCPLIFGGASSPSLARAVRLGDGFIGAGSSSTKEFADCCRQLRQDFEIYGRDPKAFSISKRVYIAVDSDPERAVRRLREWFGAWYGRPQLAEEVAIWGSVATCADKLRQVADAGAETILLNPVFDELEQMEILAQEVIPHVR